MPAQTDFSRVVPVSAVSYVGLVVYVLEVTTLGHLLDRAADYAELGEGVGSEYPAVND